MSGKFIAVDMKMGAEIIPVKRLLHAVSASNSQCIRFEVFTAMTMKNECRLLECAAV
jgi:hypothetical protein